MRVSRLQAAENRERILEVATRLFRERGIDGIGLDDLMKAAGLTHGGFYGHFKSKEDLVAQACARAVCKDATELDQRCRASHRRPPRSARRHLPHAETSRRRRSRLPHGRTRSEVARQGPHGSPRLHRRTPSVPRVPHAASYKATPTVFAVKRRSPPTRASSVRSSSPAPSTIRIFPTKSCPPSRRACKPTNRNALNRKPLRRKPRSKTSKDSKRQTSAPAPARS